jgi:Domain of unknown function (DUF4157)
MPEFDLSVAEYAKSRRLAEPEQDQGTREHMPFQSMGNAAIARMLQREEAPEEEEVLAKHDPLLATTLQREAAPEEEVPEEEVMAKHDPSMASTLQREASEELPEEEEVMAKHDPAMTSNLQSEEVPEEEEVLAKHDSVAQREGAPEVGLAGGGVSDGLAGRIDSMRGSGSPLDDNTKSTMEEALGTSMAGVRVHVGSESDSLNHAITAKAFTTGNDVFVRSDQWAPGSSSTQRLMAHELTHVAQQRQGVGGGSGGGMSVGASDTHEEHEADSVAEAVMNRSVQRSDEDEA